MNSTYVFSSEIEAKDFYTRFEWKMRKRSEGRDTNEVEMKIFADFIINVPNKNLWSYPVKITHQDRPDFLIETTQKRIGIEVTEQWSKHFGKALSMSEHIDGFIEYSDFNLKNDNKKKSGKEIARLVSKTNLTGPPSMGYQEEENWIQRTINTIERKIKKFSSYPNNQSYDDNFLLIFDVSPEIPIFEDITPKMLCPIYSLRDSCTFSSVFFMDSHIGQIDLVNQTFKIIRERYVPNNE